jgi:hypothetical protein
MLDEWQDVKEDIMDCVRLIRDLKRIGQRNEIEDWVD